MCIEKRHVYVNSFFRLSHCGRTCQAFLMMKQFFGIFFSKKKKLKKKRVNNTVWNAVELHIYIKNIMYEMS